MVSDGGSVGMVTNASKLPRMRVRKRKRWLSAGSAMVLLGYLSSMYLKLTRFGRNPRSTRGRLFCFARYLNLL